MTGHRDIGAAEPRPSQVRGLVWSAEGGSAIEDHRRSGSSASERTSFPGFDRCFSIPEAAEILGTSQSTVRRLLRGGRLTYERVSPRRTVIRESALRAYLERVAVTGREVGQVYPDRRG